MIKDNCDKSVNKPLLFCISLHYNANGRDDYV
nr:MAG TPA: hypothetical protein [Caudoviricetes sp.]